MKNDKKNNDDVVIEDGSDSAGDLDISDESAVETVKKMREKLKRVETERLEYLTGWQRAKADLINARKRDEADRLEFLKFSNEQLISEIIPVLEHWDMALNHKESWEKGDQNWRIGVESIFNQLKKVLADNGLTELNPLNEKFDHSAHEAVSYEVTRQKESNHKIIAVIQKGYALKGKVLKVPKVKVAEYKNPNS